MLFSGLISLISERIPIQTVNIRDIFDIKNTALIDGVQEEFQSGVLYLGYYEQIGSQKLPPQCVLVRTELTEALDAKSGDLALIEESSLFHLSNLAKTFVDASRSKGLYAELMDCAAQTKSITAFVNLVAAKLGNSIVLLDTDYKVLAYSNIYPIDDPLWEQNIRQGYCSYEFISAVNEMDIIKNAPKTPEPFVVTCYASPLRKLSSRIYRNGRMIGSVIMLENENLLSPSHFEMLPIVSSAAGDIIARFAPYLLPDSTLYQRLLFDLLIGTPLEKLTRHIDKLSFSPHMCALRISQTRDLGQKHLKEQIAEKTKALLPGTQLALHENGIAALVALGDATDISQEQLLLLSDFAKDENLYIGVSNAFTKIEDFALHYSQARRAQELEKRLSGQKSVCRYSDYTFFDLLSKVNPSENLAAFRHPALDLLKSYDEENNTELYSTLNAYLSCGCNIKITAERLFIHRNSLAYRLKRIYELTQISPEDVGTRFLLEMSFRLDRFTCGARDMAQN
jgi:PucR family transcriptional regulator, proline-responsive transcriptional activator